MVNKCKEALRDDLNTPVLIAHLFDGVKTIRSLAESREHINAGDLDALKSLYETMVYDVLGLIPSANQETENNLTADLVEMILQLRKEAKENKDYRTADQIREGLTRLGLTLRDHQEGTDWEIN